MIVAPEDPPMPRLFCQRLPFFHYDGLRGSVTTIRAMRPYKKYPNLVVSIQLEREGLAPFGFLSFTPIGLLVLATGIVYLNR